MNRVLPPASDVIPLLMFLGLLLAFNMGAGLILPTWGVAFYGAWLAVGIAALARAGVEPGLPKSFWGNLRRLLRRMSYIIGINNMLSGRKHEALQGFGIIGFARGADRLRQGF